MKSENEKNSKLLGLGKLKDRLLNLNPLYNRKIRFYISERLAWDLTELLSKNYPKKVADFSFSILSLLINPGESKKNFSLDLESFFKSSTPEKISKFQKKVFYLQKKNLAVYQEKGYKALFLGVVFLRGYFRNTSQILRFVNAPLFLLPCDLEKIKNLSLVFHSERKVNYSLLYYLQKELGLAKEKLTDFLNKLEDSKGMGNWEDYLIFLTQGLQNWLSASPVKIKPSLVISSLIEKEENNLLTANKEEIKEPIISPFVEPDSTIANNSDLIGWIVSKENKEVHQKGNYFGNVIYKLKIEWEKSNSNNLQNPEAIFVYPNLVSGEILASIKQNQFLNKKYLFACEKDLKGWVLRNWQEIENDLDYLPFHQEPKRKYFQPEPFVKLTLSDKPKHYLENELEIVGNFCLTIDSEPNLSLFRDFEKIIEEYSHDKVIGWSNSALALLRGEVESVVSYPPEQQGDKQQLKSLYLPFESDPSQTRILKVIFRRFFESALCIDGPPGTGKSQLICNLLANALAYQKKVLVVCEKEVALKVIYEKLSSIDLNRSIIKVNELAQTPQVYRDILNHLENNQQKRTNRYICLDNEKQVADLEEKQISNLKKIVDYCQVENEFRTNRQVPLQEVYLKFSKKYRLSPTLIQLNKWIKNKEQLSKLKIDLEKYVSKFSKILEKWKPICLQLKNIFLKNSSQEFEFDWESQNNFQEIVSNILRELNGGAKTNFLLRVCCIKLIQECSKKHQSIKLLEVKIEDLEDLQTRPNYQNFFTFLQLKNFDDFWQKCSDKEFLLTVQQFISEEFLVLGELHFFHANFDENTKKSIDHFLWKVLVDQEFDYLNDYGKICEQAVYFNWIKEVEERNKETLANWNQEEIIRIQHEQREIAKKKKDLAKAILKSKQKENLDKISANQSLIKELSKKRKISSLKKLFPELVNYFPIWLTTPEVIASITNWQEVPFDFLVFDEASQMPLEKSIPLWARAKKCIVIGDEQQLPPTDFFKSHLGTEEEIWEKEENESSLNNTKKNINLEIDDLEKNSNLLSYAKKYARNREKLTLLYHYRSRYPELIEFSNQAFYNGILQIVSASERKRDYSPIEYHHQSEGRWIDTENQVEARYITELLKNPRFIGKEVGIITFNSKQRDLLIDLIEEGNNYKNLFIKSLEEVQGDERDIIIFSIGYGPNKEGKIFLNFGPLSNEGGEKRLNVAISRAREKIIIVTSLSPGDLNRIVEEDENRKLGPKLFKKYLEYAYYCWKKEPKKVQDILEKSLPKIVSTFLYKRGEEQEEFGSLFEEQVYNELINQNNHGYEIHKQVKSVGYSIDLAIWNSQLQQYVLGIECDGEYWHGKLENIERDIYRQQLLEDKGWRIIRILSRDWCRNKEIEMSRIKKEINECKETSFSDGNI